MCNNTVISQPCIENSLIISLADNTNEIASLTAHLMSPFLSQLLVCCTILYLSRLIERRSGAGRAYREGTFLFTVGEDKGGAAYVHGDQGRATPSLKEVGFPVFVKEKIGALGLADVDSYGNADSTQDEDSALNNAAMSRKSW